jgi:hypothetical protein
MLPPVEGLDGDHVEQVSGCGRKPSNSPRPWKITAPQEGVQGMEDANCTTGKDNPATYEPQ